MEGVNEKVANKIHGMIPKSETMTLRGDILFQAMVLINGERQDSYGSPENSFKVIADFWQIYLDGKRMGDLNAHDVCMMMALFKIAREMHQKKKDNLADGAGYLGIAGDLYE